MLIDSSSFCLSIVFTAGAHLPVECSFWSAGGLEVARQETQLSFLSLLNILLLSLSQTATYSRVKKHETAIQSNCHLRMPESKKPGQVSFYPLLPLDYLLCDWLAGRACSGGRANNYRLVGLLVTCGKGCFWICGMFPHVHCLSAVKLCQAWSGLGWMFPSLMIAYFIIGDSLMSWKPENLCVNCMLWMHSSMQW